MGSLPAPHAARSFTVAPPERLVRFEGLAGSREMAFVGMVEVGWIGPAGPTQFSWRLWLPGGPQFGRAPTLKAARDHLISRIEQWIEAADLKSVKA